MIHGTLTPTKQNFTLAPTNATFSNLSGNQTANFTATLNLHQISGRVTDINGISLPNVGHIRKGRKESESMLLN